MAMQEDITKIKEMLEPKGKERKFRLPWGSRVNKVKAKKNYVTLMKINENGSVEFKRVQISEQTFLEEGIPRLAAAGYVTYYKGNPMIILPSWSVEPFSPMESYNKSLLDGSNCKGYKLLMNRMKLSTIDSKPQIGGMIKWIFMIGVALIIGYAFITGSG